ncbi:subtilisin-like protease SBT6.1 [Solanum dulcamara]|uniref:subtilisin-like protease SBT6.1 n=1 Tax=Solanum dulcamara TaxID=45834 RepID=UPI0024869700|nr:subtilisin-like protease SBT6.1 [Solanum dulcamara]XP_055808007.1 subtilisin-like protease SBT6.1 [Solanum dulcamara]
MPQTPKKSFFSFSLIPFLLVYTLIRFDSSLFVQLLKFPQCQTLTMPESVDSEPFISSSSDDCHHHQKQQSDSKNYIVRFYQYRKAEDHWNYLQDNLKFKGWQWIERRNPAARFPTDFGLVAIDKSAKELLLEKFIELNLVKDVSLDLSYQRIVLEEKSEKIGAFANGKKRPGKIFSAMSFSESQNYAVANNSKLKISWKRHLLMQKPQVTSLFGAHALWSKGITGAKVKMAIFDTGIRAGHLHFRNIKERTNWTNEDTLNDNVGHGTFVAGVIASQDEECHGFAPDTEIYAFRVFTDAQVSYTSWFLDAFNYAIATNMDVLNLSIGGPDYLDLPFVEKVWELTANNIIMVSAVGNDGPLYGTLNNPADQSDVIGVGAIDYSDHVASFSSRGMSTWEIPHGYGRVKPDLVAYGREIMGSKISTGCKRLSGTSVASPVVAGVVCLLVSIVPENKRKGILNPASVKQALVEGATKLSGPSLYEQGAGRVNLLESYEILKHYKPRASIFPSVLDYTDCPYSWPFCRQPLYAGAMPVIFNATILNGMGVVGYVESPPTWHPSNHEGNLLSIRFTYSDVIWPWCGYLALHIQIKEEGAQFSEEIEGNITVKIYSPPAVGEKSRRSSACVLHLKLQVIPTPPRSVRILWDQFHSIKYPPGYIPIDSFDVRNDLLDWHGDHLHTNFHSLFNMLRDAGYYIETLGSPLTCFDANQYGTLLLVDLEDEYFPEEIKKLQDDVINSGLGLAVFADWYNVDSMVKMRFFDGNTHSWWTPVTGGANVPALNDLLATFGIAFGDKILNGDFFFSSKQNRYASGTDILKFPSGGYLHSFPFLDRSQSMATQNVILPGMAKIDSPILGFLEVGGGGIAVYGDSNCLDSSHMVADCYWLLKKILDFTSRNEKDPVLFSDSVRQNTPLYVDNNKLPSRRTDVNFSMYSSVVGKELICERDSRFEVWGTKGYNLPSRRKNCRLPAYPGNNLGTGLNSTVETNSAQKNGDSLENKYWSSFYKDDIDMPLLVTSHWFVPAIVAIIGLMLLFWGMQQRGMRRRRSSSGHFSSL